MPGTSRVCPTLRGGVGTLTRCLSVGKAGVDVQLVDYGIWTTGAVALLLQSPGKFLASHLLRWWSCCGI